MMYHIFINNELFVTKDTQNILLMNRFNLNKSFDDQYEYNAEYKIITGI